MLGKRLVEARKRVGLSQHRLAIELGERYDQTMISHVEHGRRAFVYDGLVRAARILDTSTDYLAGLTDDPAPVDERVQEAQKKSYEAGARKAEERAQEAEARIRREEARNRQQLEAALERTEAELERLRAEQDGAAGLDTLEGVEAALRKLGLRLAPWRRQVGAAAGYGAVVEDETIEDYLVFREWWLQKKGIGEMGVIQVVGDSMSPTMKDEDAILVDNQRTRRLHDHIYVVRTEDGLVVKRLVRDGDGWVMISDNEDQVTYPPVPWPEDAIVRGEVMWTGKTLRGSR